MDGIRLPRHLAITAVAMLLAAPLARADDTMHRHTIIPLPYNSGTVIDEFNGNDARDTRDSTIARSDVPIDQTGLRSADTMYRTDTSTSSTSERVVTSRGVGPLPDTAVAEAGHGTVTTPQNDGPATASRETTPSGSVTDSMHSTTDKAAAQTDTFEGNRDTAAGVDSTRGAGSGH